MEQIISVEQQIDCTSRTAIKLPKHLDRDLAPLEGGDSVPRTEEAMRFLGQYMGFNSTRPERESDTGPDVLWMMETGTAICIEMKTDKAETSQYKKSDVGQLSDHIQWVKDNTDANEIIPVFVGPLLPPSRSANPSRAMLVIEMSQFNLLGKRLIAALRDATTDAIALELRSNLVQQFGERDLMWPNFFESLEKTRLRDLK